MKLNYIIEVSIDEKWIEDGFDLRTEQDIKNLLKARLPYAYDNEVEGKVISAPNLDFILKLQGY
jgi:hypothetical protein